jgi:hypothetical protein
MALGYEIGTIMKRTTTILAVGPAPAADALGAAPTPAPRAENCSSSGVIAAAVPAPPPPPSPPPAAAAVVAAEELMVKMDDVGGLGRFMQILGRDRERVAALGRDLGLEGTYIPRSYIEQVGRAGYGGAFRGGGEWRCVNSAV